VSSPTPAPTKTIDLKTAFAYAVRAAEEGRSGEAEGLYRAILKSHPVSEAARNLGLILDESGRWDEAEQVYRAFLKVAPDDQVIRLQLSFLLLRDGRLREAWPLFEARLHRPGAAPKPRLSYPEWRGQPVSSLLIWHEQGLGDQIQFARFAQQLSADISVTLMCHPALVRLFAPLDVTVIGTEGQVSIPRHEAWVMSGSIPGLLGTSLETIPSAPYLPALKGGSGIGVMTRGAQGHPNDVNRSLPEELAATLRGLPGAVGLAPADTGAKDMRETADIIAGLDLVISVDTAVAHVAGAMGKPCWLMLPHRADWRWLRRRADSPWYPTTRLFRQPAPGDWGAVLADIQAALAARTA
jgi:hypothetical protein